MSAPAPEVEFEEVLLERMTVAAQEAFSPQLLAAMGARVLVDHMQPALTAQLYTYVTTTRPLTEDREVPFGGDLEVELPPRQFRDRVAFLFGRRERISVLVYGHVTVTARDFTMFPDSTYEFPGDSVLGRGVRATETRACRTDLREGHGGE